MTRTRAQAQLEIVSSDGEKPGPVQARPDESSPRKSASDPLVINIRRRPSLEDLEQLDWYAQLAWRSLAAAMRDSDSMTWAGLTGLQANVKRMGSPCSLYVLRVGLRELVDAGVVYCKPDPSAGKRLPY